MGEWRQQALELQKLIAEHPCSWCGRSRGQLPDGEQHLCLLIDEASNTAELSCDDCMAKVAGGALVKFKQHRERQAESPSPHSIA